MGKTLTQRRWRGPTTWKDMLQHALRDAAELANKKTEQLYKVASPCLDDHQSRRRILNQLRIIKKYAHTLSQNACIWHELDDLTSCGLSTIMQEQSPNGLRLVASVEDPMLRRKRDRDLDSVRTSSDRRNLHNTWNGKLSLPCEETTQRRKDYLKLKAIWR